MSDFRVFVLLCVVLGGMGQGIVAPKLPELLDGSSQITFDSGLSASLMYLGIFISTFYYGKAADRGRVHWLLGPGLLAYSAVLVLLGLAPSRGWFFVLRFFEGLSLSAIFVAADFVLGRLSLPGERGRWLSYYGVALSLGLLLGPLLSLALLGVFSISFFIAAIVALILGAFSFSYRISKTESLNSSVMKKALNPRPLVSAVVYGFMEASLVATLPILALTHFLVRPELGLIVIILSAAGFSLVWGSLADKKSAREVVLFLLFALSFGTLGLFGAHLNSVPGLWIFYLSCVFFGALAGGLYPIGFAWLLDQLPEAQYGQASGAFARYYGIGSLFGPLLIGWSANRWEMSGLYLGLSIVGGLGFAFSIRR